MSALGIAKWRERDEPSHFSRVVILDCRLEMLALRRGLAQLSPQPTQQAHGCLIRHAAQAIAVRASVFGVLVEWLVRVRLGRGLRPVVGQAVCAEPIRKPCHPPHLVPLVTRLGLLG